MTTPINSSRKRPQRDYTFAFKLGGVERVEKGEMTYKQAQARFGIQGRSTVLFIVTTLRTTSFLVAISNTA